jgi:hypothetical protein
MSPATVRTKQAITNWALHHGAIWLLLALLLAFPAASAAPVDPASVIATLAPGGSMTVTKTVHTPAIPPNPDIVFLVDTTTSMGPAIANVKANLPSILAGVQGAQPTAQFAVAQYKDQVDPAPYFSVLQNLTGDQGLVQAGINSLFQVASGAIAFRPNGTRIVLLIGDASSHDPSAGHSQTATIAALQAAGIRVLAFDVGPTPDQISDGLNGAGQAATIAAATGGQLFAGVNPAQASGTILGALQNLPIIVTPAPACSPGLTATFDAPSKTVTSGQDVTFNEIIGVALNAPAGALTCTVQFLLNGNQTDGFVQTVQIKRPLTVRADDATKVYGGPNPPFGATAFGLAPGDTLANLGITCTSPATTTSPVGDYPIICGGNPANYTVTYVPGTLHVTKAATTTTVTASAATYDALPHAATAVATGPVGLNQALAVTYSGRNTTTYGPTTTPPTDAGDYRASASFPGDANYLPSADSKDFTIAKAPTQLAITSAGALALDAQGRVTVTAGGVTASGTTDANGVATAKLALPSEQYMLTASFAGDNNYLPSDAAAQKLIVYQLTQFVIWGGNAGGVVTGKDYQFWGAQWAKQVTGGDYRANNSFKGYADILSPDGKTWTASPGGSGNPPATVAPYIGVIVTTHTTKDGATISGNVERIVVLKVDAPSGYQPNPGHPGTGVLVALIP